MAKKKTSILSALDGGHLDGSLFGRVYSKTRDAAQDNTEQAQLSGDKRRGWRFKGFAKSRKQTGSETRSDTGL
ncbi:MAG: hypothetical protein AAFY06_10100 [Pseudomonadota bacterium]